ncbi:MULTISPECIES: helix-turn-helix domain-containing protein [Pseudonocardia]|uniref:HTH-type transcriptional activator RhaR n=2 Tax=Pseudonocardia TaxID=1847 RepID=A0A1Y2N1I4_PSEAH|nr:MULTISPECIES: AraC family transcriptional regulator [Pseudonocardia]OSY41323.1 HTH-type transcriptional activator RhaR [Pseudonocardia autotrophica]TDN76779.1 AraC family transcriptional regulator [Pseudonocardia autotrophica]
MTERPGAGRWRTSAALRPLVAEFWVWRTAGGPPGTHQGVPGGHLTVILCIDGDVELLRKPDPGRGPGRFTASAAGLHAVPAVIATGAPQAGLQLPLTWRGARTLLGLPAAELAGDVIDLAELWPDTGSLLDRLHAAPTWATRCALLDAHLCRLAARRTAADGPPAEIGRAWDRLVASGGTARVTELAADVGWSARHLGDRLRRETGLGTKTAARVIRFERACTLLRSADRPALTDVAADCGFADQQHLAREFRALAGTTAGAWLAERVSGLSVSPA